ncbi:putative uncharacterized protein [Clostridium sp. CAG:448]|nr:putative uncharacterized protein [Clostridium sp. CAG:448]
MKLYEAQTRNPALLTALLDIWERFGILGGKQMILYFSATGNCKYVATRLAQATGQEMYSIADCIRNGQYDFSDGTVGIISPAYDWGLPSIVKEFLEKASFRTDYLYFAATYGTIPGAIGYMANKAIRERTIDAYYSVRMPDTWTPIFDLSTPEKVAKYTRHTKSEIDRMIQGVRERRTNRHLRPRTPAIITKLIAEPLYNKKVRCTSNLHAENTCIGCGLCAKKCPVQAIAMRDGRPVWVKDRCVMCLGCLHRCPKFAIQYGNRTKKHGQYTNPNVKV